LISSKGKLRFLSRRSTDERRNPISPMNQDSHPPMLAKTKLSIPAARWIRIVSPTIVVYIIAYMDRMNISFAIAGAMNKSLALSPTSAGMAAGVFFFGYMFLQAPPRRSHLPAWQREKIRPLAILARGRLVNRIALSDSCRKLVFVWSLERYDQEPHP